MTGAEVRGAAIAAITTAIVAGVTTGTIITTQTTIIPLAGTVIVWIGLFAGVNLINIEATDLPQFAVVFCGSLLGLTLLFGTLVNYHLLNTYLTNPYLADATLAVNPVMAILVGGALALAYTAVFEWGTTTRHHPF